MFSLGCFLKHMKCYANSIVIRYYQLSEFTVIRLLIIFLFSLHLGIQSGPCEDQLIKLDEQCSEKTYKVTSDRISRLLNAETYVNFLLPLPNIYLIFSLQCHPSCKVGWYHNRMFCASLPCFNPRHAILNK